MKITKSTGEFEFFENLKLKMANTMPSCNDKQASNNAPAKIRTLSEDAIADECEKIEKCASSDTEYILPEDIDIDSQKQIKEFASAIGFAKVASKVTSVKSTTEPINNKIASVFEKIEEPIVKTASTTSSTKEATKKTINIGDAFGFDKKIAEIDSRKAVDWQVNKPAKSLDIKPSFDFGIVPIRGSENTNINNNPKLAMNQNSMASPNAIEDLFNSKELMTGERLKIEKEQRKQARIEAHADWQNDKIKSMPNMDIVPKGVVFPTEVLKANTGIGNGSSEFGIYAKTNQMESLPEKTTGERLKDMNMERKSSIQREHDKFSWDNVDTGAAYRTTSEVFTDSLKNLLNKKRK